MKKNETIINLNILILIIFVIRFKNYIIDNTPNTIKLYNKI